ncbi:MAG: Crp/Fnr family transcriptional regulator [Spirosomataceae bacterium]
MLETVTEIFSQFNFLSPKDLFELASIAKLRMVKKDEHLISEGDLCYDTFMVLKGLFRHYTVDENGVDRTLLFVPERRPTASPDTILLNNAAIENIIALENSLVLKIDTRVFGKIASDNVRLLKLKSQVYEQVIISNVAQIKFLTLLNPEDRYVHFCKTFPDLEQRIKQKYLASYLGVTPTSLSRMRARLAKG